MQPRGFIALISGIIISAILLVTVATGSLAGFFSRSDSLDAELKERSVGAADACADQAILLVSQASAYTGSFGLALNSMDSCQATVATAGSQKSLKIQATSSTAVTNLQIVLKSTDASVVSWQETAIY